MTLNESGTNVTTTVDASAMTGEFKFTEGVTNDVTITGSATAKNTFVMGATLNNDDTLTGGSSTKDSVSATVNGSTATTGKFSLTAIETLALTVTDASTNTVDLSSSSGVSAVTIAASAGAGNGAITVKGLASGTTVSTTDQGTNDFDGTLTVALADATGTSDAITIGLENDQSADDFTFVSSGIETVTFAGNTTDGINAGTDVDISGSDATSIVLSGGDASSKVNFSGANANKALTSVDASGWAGIVDVDASTATTAAAVTANLGTFDASSGDAATGSTATGNNDKLIGTLAATDAAAAFVTGFSQFENYEITIGDAVDITTASNEGMGDGDNVVETITISGGNALSSYTSTDGAIDGTSLTSFDASGFKGTTSVTVNAGIADTVTLKAGSATDDSLTFSAVNGLAKATTGKLAATGFETVALLTATAASTIDASGLTGTTTIAVENDQNVTLSGVAAGTTIQLGATTAAATDDYSGTVTVSLADATGTSDSLTFTTVKSAADDQLDATLSTTGIESVTITHNAVAGQGDGDLNVWQ